MGSIIMRKLRQSYSMEKALIPILEQHIRQGGNSGQVLRCMQKILKETRQQAGRAEEYLQLIKSKSRLS